MRFLKSIAALALIGTLAACGGSNGGGSSKGSSNPDKPSSATTSSTNNGLLTIAGKAEPGTTIVATFPDKTTKSVVVESDGTFSLTSAKAQPSGETSVISKDSDGNESEATTLKFTDTTAPEAPSSLMLEASADGTIKVTGRAEPLSTVTITFPDGSKKTGTANADGLINFDLSSTSNQAAKQITAVTTDAEGNVSLTSYISAEEVTVALYRATGKMPELTFIPSLGINTEAPQGGVGSAGMPMPFVDIFRTARPFPELSGANAKFDENGWPTQVDSSVTVARTKILQGARQYSIPDGRYTVLYDVADASSVSLEFNQKGPTVTNTKKTPKENKYTFDLDLQDFDSDEDSEAEVNAVLLNVRGITPDNYVKNIRVIMPGGTCKDSSGEFNPYIRATSDSDCPTNTQYVSFEERLLADRNEIIFNPDYLMFLRNFKVVRMMNFMEASLKDLCGGADTSCPEGVGTWSHRASINDAVWGGDDGRTEPEDHKGVPIDVMVQLANTIKKDIWINIPHIANDEYTSNYAQQVFNTLDPSLKVYLEYSNEVWNSGFAGYQYMTLEGMKIDGFDTLPTSPYDYKKFCDALPTTTAKEIQRKNSSRCEQYFARLRFFSNRSVEIFDIWGSQFGSNSPRLEKVLGSFIGDKLLTDLMLQNIKNNIGTNKVDSVAIAPYFFGCTVASQCPNATHQLINAITVNDVYAAIDQAAGVDVKSLEGTIEAVKSQLTVITKHNTDNSDDVKLVTYEGGQHLVTGIFGTNITEANKPRLRKLFHSANRDPRMKSRYYKFLNAWKDLSPEGTTLFTLYTMPQSFYRFGNFGIKEHLNMPRNESPKFDGAMTFQEAVEDSWWDN